LKRYMVVPLVRPLFTLNDRDPGLACEEISAPFTFHDWLEAQDVHVEVERFINTRYIPREVVYSTNQHIHAPSVNGLISYKGQYSLTVQLSNISDTVLVIQPNMYLNAHMAVQLHVQ